MKTAVLNYYNHVVVIVKDSRLSTGTIVLSSKSLSSQYSYPVILLAGFVHGGESEIK